MISAQVEPIRLKVRNRMNRGRIAAAIGAIRVEMIQNET